MGTLVLRQRSHDESLARLYGGLDLLVARIRLEMAACAHDWLCNVRYRAGIAHRSGGLALVHRRSLAELQHV